MPDLSIPNLTPLTKSQAASGHHSPWEERGKVSSGVWPPAPLEAVGYPQGNPTQVTEGCSSGRRPVTLTERHVRRISHFTKQALPSQKEMSHELPSPVLDEEEAGSGVGKMQTAPNFLPIK